MGRRKCCVTGCKSTSETHCVYSFPNDKNLRMLWMSYLVPHNSSLLILTEDQLSSKTVCQLHFERRMFDAKGVRLPKAHPCLFTNKEISHGMPLATDYNVKMEHNYCQTAFNEERNIVSHESYFILRPGESVEHCYHTTATPTTCLEDQQSSIIISENILSTCIQPIIRDIPSTSQEEYTSNVVQNTSKSLAYNKQTQKVLSATKKMAGKNRKLATKIINIAKDNIGNNNASRTQQAQNLSSSGLMEEFHNLSGHTKTFIRMQLKSLRSTKMARRYDLEEKLMCLTIMKQSRKNYKLLRHMFSLPSQRTLNRLSEKIVFDTGINDNILRVIREKSKKWSQEQKLCSIVFDEVSINTQLTYNEEKDVIYGFSDIAGQRKMTYCDHALVIMIRGVCVSWRQPLAYYFCEGTTAAVELKGILKEVVTKLVQSGLLPLTLICDQGSTFRTAIKQLRQETIRYRTINNICDDGTIHISGHNVSIIYDPPHLIKGIRNNLLNKDMMFESKIATWKDIIAIYDIDNTLGHTKAMPKITKHHVDKDSIRKMRVSVATQVLSARVAAMLRYTNAVVKSKDGGSLSPTMSTTADVVEFFDQLFDSVNGRPGDNVRGKLRTAVKQNSKHLSFWQQASKKLAKISFIDKNGRIAYVPSIRGWITTLESFIRITKILFSKYDISFFYPRFLNQDPLENFFGRLRANNYRNVIPDANAFIYTFKSLVLSNVLSPTSKFANCEEDEGDQLINLELLFKNSESNKGNILSDDENKENISPNVPNTSGSQQMYNLLPVVVEKVKVHCSAYVAGFICRKLYKILKCTKCQNTVTTKDMSSIHKYIMYREYKTLKNLNLAYPNEKFLMLYRQCSQLIHNYLNKYCCERNIGKILKSIFKNQCNFEWMGCSSSGHNENIKQMFFRLIIRLQVHNWVKMINKILRGAISEKNVNKKETVQMKALIKFNKRRKSKK